ncbi:MAG TPA: hypothetical protein VFX07_15085 [Candidatus Udaeobacter sp.]|jgi:hypothetical protein|nr:hypothetical protein [Candidatus Udaeobacter sp.]
MVRPGAVFHIALANDHLVLADISGKIAQTLHRDVRKAEPNIKSLLVALSFHVEADGYRPNNPMQHYCLGATLFALHDPAKSLAS